jgi:hypothetical protein
MAEAVATRTRQPYTKAMPARTLIALIAAAALPVGAAYAQGRMVDLLKVAPEYRAAAEKRAAEQKKLASCQKDADAKKLLPRYRTKFLAECIEK